MKWVLVYVLDIRTGNYHFHFHENCVEHFIQTKSLTFQQQNNTKCYSYNNKKYSRKISTSTPASDLLPSNIPIINNMWFFYFLIHLFPIFTNKIFPYYSRSSSLLLFIMCYVFIQKFISKTFKIQYSQQLQHLNNIPILIISYMFLWTLFMNLLRFLRYRKSIARLRFFGDLIFI